MLKHINKVNNELRLIICSANEASACLKYLIVIDKASLLLLVHAYCASIDWREKERERERMVVLEGEYNQEVRVVTDFKRIKFKV